MASFLNRVPLVRLSSSELPPRRNNVSYDDESDDGHGPSKKPWYSYVPLCITILLLLLPHPSLLLVLTNYHLLTLHSTPLFLAHLTVLYTLTFLCFCSLIVCAARDPGPVPRPATKDAEEDGEGEMSITAALMGGPPEDDYSLPGRWCRICWAPKPERAHHCSECGRCVLKMDHHCPWIGAKCVGYRTYPSFLHLLLCVTLYAIYLAGMNIEGLVYAFAHPLNLDTHTPLHMLFLSFIGVVFGITIGAFLGYHIYLTLTNQTTLENITAFALLRHLPPLPGGIKLSSPPFEHELSHAQRRAVRAAHRSIRLYDLGTRENVRQVFGGWPKSARGWTRLVMSGGGTRGDGTRWTRSAKAERGLERLKDVIVRLEVEGEGAFDSEAEVEVASPRFSSGEMSPRDA
ncbi:zf-DHHC-domain-containing protein [Peniophora sp. CONT]|nr:zf-DHHC-domain-containing protein [Peniophora sp. CONT]